jgi:hypothetical protein
MPIPSSVAETPGPSTPRMATHATSLCEPKRNLICLTPGRTQAWPSLWERLRTWFLANFAVISMTRSENAPSGEAQSSAGPDG